MSDLTVRLLAAIDEAERDVRESPEWPQWNIAPSRMAARINAVLRRCAADRDLVEACTWALRGRAPQPRTFANLVLRDLARGYGITVDEGARP